MILSTTFGSSAYSASAPQVEVVFNVGRTVATLGTSLYVLGFALGPLAFGPSSEVVGRKPVYLVSFVLLTAFNIGVCFAQTIEGLLICRFFAGFMWVPSIPLGHLCASSPIVPFDAFRLAGAHLHSITSLQ